MFRLLPKATKVDLNYRRLRIKICFNKTINKKQTARNKEKKLNNDFFKLYEQYNNCLN